MVTVSAGTVLFISDPLELAAGIDPDRPIRSMEKFFLGDQTEADRIVSSLGAAAFTSIAGLAGIFVGIP